ncbi:hypothetical protein AVEN_240229-1, partial [Araneus ventricosus]
MHQSLPVGGTSNHRRCGNTVTPPLLYPPEKRDLLIRRPHIHEQKGDPQQCDAKKVHDIQYCIVHE